MQGRIAFSWRGANVTKWILCAQAKIQNGCFKRSAHADCRSSLRITNVYDIRARECEKGPTFLEMTLLRLQVSLENTSCVL